ncbi:hypothetical protein SAY87_012918 [Trapa incisa]|uniref:Uncharacterized protein n=1 Tax=Trapa incisa TaxID=236973 RepID=A0AAN7KIL9_9MYRT|nr:hypothetical protein SAY87_012918 [Trapa incisa]
MKTVSGEIITTRPVSLSKASKVLSRFVTVDNGASHPIGIYLRKASEAFHELVEFHKGIRSSSLAESVDNPAREIETEDASSDQRKHKHREKKMQSGHDSDSGLVVADGDSRRVESLELANGDGKLTELGSEKKKQKRKDKKLKGEDGNAVNNVVENSQGNVGIGKDGTVKEGELNVNINGSEDADRKKKKKEKKKGDFRVDIGEDGTLKVGMRNSKDVKSNIAEDPDGKTKNQKRKEKKGDASVGTGEDGAVKEEGDRGKKRKMEMSDGGKEKDDSIERQGKKKKKIG